MSVPWVPQPRPHGHDKPVPADRPGPSRGVLEHLKQPAREAEPGWLERWGGWLASFVWAKPGPKPDENIPAAVLDLSEERVAAGPAGVAFPWIAPYVDDVTAEPAAARFAYRMMWANPEVKAATLGAILSAAALDLKVVPAKGGSKESLEVAHFVEWNLQERLKDGIPGLMWSVLSGGLPDGYSICEKTWLPERRGRHAGKWALASVKPKDAGNDVYLETDQYRNVIGVRGLRYNPGLIWHPSRFLIWRYLPLYDSPVGMSAFRAAYQAWWMLDTAHKLRAVAAEKRAIPFLVGTYKSGSQRASLEAMLGNVKSQNWASVPEGVVIDALNIAGSADDVFAGWCKDQAHRVFLAIAGATLQGLEGTIPNARGSAKVQAGTADRFVWWLAASVQQLLNDHDCGLVRDMVDLNYAVSDYPKCVLGAVDLEELKAELEIDKGLASMKLALSKQELYERYGRTPPDSDEDALEDKPPEAPGGDPLAALAGGGPPPGGGPGGPPAPTDGQPDPWEGIEAAGGDDPFDDDSPASPDVSAGLSGFSEWDEAKHPRDGGKFASKPGAGAKVEGGSGGQAASAAPVPLLRHPAVTAADRSLSEAMAHKDRIAREGGKAGWTLDDLKAAGSAVSDGYRAKAEAQREAFFALPDERIGADEGDGLGLTGRIELRTAGETDEDGETLYYAMEQDAEGGWRMRTPGSPKTAYDLRRLFAGGYLPGIDDEDDRAVLEDEWKDAADAAAALARSAPRDDKAWRKEARARRIDLSAAYAGADGVEVSVQLAGQGSRVPARVLDAGSGAVVYRDSDGRFRLAHARRFDREARAALGLSGPQAFAESRHEAFAEADWRLEPTARSKNRWKHVRTGRIAYGAANPGASKAKAAKPEGKPAEAPGSPAKAKPVRGGKGDPAAVKAALEAARGKAREAATGTPEEAHAARQALADAILSLTVPQADALARELGSKPKGRVKMEKAAALAAWAMEAGEEPAPARAEPAPEAKPEAVAAAPAAAVAEPALAEAAPEAKPAPGGSVTGDDTEAMAKLLASDSTHTVEDLLKAAPGRMRGLLGEALAKLEESGAVQLYFGGDPKNGVEVDGEPVRGVAVLDRDALRDALSGFAGREGAAAAPAGPEAAPEAPWEEGDDFQQLLQHSMANGSGGATAAVADQSAAQKLNAAMMDGEGGKKIPMERLKSLHYNLFSGHWPGKTPGSPAHRAANEEYAKLLRQVPKAEFAAEARKGEDGFAGYDAKANTFDALLARETPGLAEVLAERLGAKPAGEAVAAAPAAADVAASHEAQSAFGDAYRDLAADGVVEIPDLVDAMRKAVPGATAQDIRDALQQWQREDKLTLQVANDRDLAGRPGEGIETPKGLAYYVQARDEAKPAKPPAEDPDVIDLDKTERVEAAPEPAKAAPEAKPASPAAPAAVDAPEDIEDYLSRPREYGQRIKDFVAAGRAIAARPVRSVPPETVQAIVADAVEAAGGNGLRASPTIPDLYKAAKAKHPGLTLPDYQSILAKAHQDGHLRLGAWARPMDDLTGAGKDRYAGTIGTAIPMDGEVKYFVRAGDKPLPASPAGGAEAKPATAEPGPAAPAAAPAPPATAGAVLKELHEGRIDPVEAGRLLKALDAAKAASAAKAKPAAPVAAKAKGPKADPAATATAIRGVYDKLSGSGGLSVPQSDVDAALAPLDAMPKDGLMEAVRALKLPEGLKGRSAGELRRIIKDTVQKLHNMNHRMEQ